MYLAKFSQPTVLSEACLSCICYSSLDWVLGIFCVLLKTSYWLWALTLNSFAFHNSRGNDDRNKCQEVLFFSHPAPDTILKLLQSPDTQGIKYKKETITTFRILSTFSCSKSTHNSTDYTSLFCLFLINDIFLSLFPSRIFFILCWSSFCCWLVILNSLVTYQVLVSSNYSLKSPSRILDVIYLNITNLIPSMLICNQWSIYLSLSLVYC